MTSETIRATLAFVWSGLESFGCERALMGGVALATWNHPRATRDIDLLVGVAREAAPQLVAHMRAIGCRPKTDPPLLVVGRHAFVQLLHTPPDEFYDVQFDLMLAESDLQRTALRRRVPRVVPGIHGTLDVLSCEDLLLFKLVAGRLIDQFDAATLLRENRESIDQRYLGEWVTRLKLTGELDAVWREAFPDETNGG